MSDSGFPKRTRPIETYERDDGITITVVEQKKGPDKEKFFVTFEREGPDRIKPVSFEYKDYYQAMHMMSLLEKIPDIHTVE